MPVHQCKSTGEASPPSEDEDVIDVPMPFRPRDPKAYRRKGRLLANPLFQHPDPNVMSVQGWLNVRYKWFSLHAGVSIDGTNRAGLRQLFHYGARSSVNLALLSYANPEDPDRSDLGLRLKRKWNDGTESLVFSQKDFVERLAGVIPPPWFNLTRFHGVFAPNHAWRDFVVPGPTTKQAFPSYDEPNDSDPPPTRKPSTGRAPAAKNFIQNILTGDIPDHRGERACSFLKLKREHLMSGSRMILFGEFCESRLCGK